MMVLVVMVAMVVRRVTSSEANIQLLLTLVILISAFNLNKSKRAQQGKDNLKTENETQHDKMSNLQEHNRNHIKFGCQSDYVSIRIIIIYGARPLNQRQSVILLCNATYV